LCHSFDRYHIHIISISFWAPGKAVVGLVGASTPAKLPDPNADAWRSAGLSLLNIYIITIIVILIIRLVHIITVINNKN